jgi:hypothetical protein
MSLKAATSPRVAHTALDFVYFQGYDDEAQIVRGRARANNPLVFKQERTTNDQVILDQFGGGGLFPERTNEEAEIQQSSPRVTNNLVNTVKEFADAVDVPKNFMDDEKHGVVKANVRDMGRRAKLSQDNYAIDRWALGFTTETTNDAVAMFSNSHTTIDGTTVDNLETGVLTAANLETTIVSLGRQKNQGGILGHFDSNLLLVPLNLLKDGSEIIDSDLLAGTGNNNINYLSRKYPGLELMFSPELDDTSTTAYFLASREHSMSRYVREDVTTNYLPWDISKNKVGTYQAWFREVVFPISYEGTVASSGTV